MNKNKTTQFFHLGSLDYQSAWDIQERLFQASVRKKTENRKRSEQERQEVDNYLLFVYHPHVFTLGKSGNQAHLLLTEQQLAEKNASFHRINRGGDITYHGPGQLVGYPILDLDNFFTDIHRYLRFLEEAIILTLKDYGVEAGRIPGLTGVWIDINRKEKARKICALGVKCARWITMHGFAFNIDVNLDYFRYIIPCGIPDKAVTSLALELGYAPEPEEVENKLKGHIARLFNMKLTEPDSGWLLDQSMRHAKNG